MQNGVFRVNCLDSLDRTNVAQSKIAMTLLHRQIKSLGFVLEDIFSKDVLKDTIAFSEDGKVVIK